jgi:hypothetical protein
MEETAMTTNTHSDASTVREAYALVMDENVNPLRELQKPRRLQLMTVLSWMWTTIFCTSFGVWYLFDELVVGHMAVGA